MLENWEVWWMINLTHVYINEIGIPIVLESSVVQIESLQMTQVEKDHTFFFFDNIL